MRTMNERTKADLLLVVITIFWGSTYVLTKVILESFESYNLISLRFLIAFVISSCIYSRRLLKRTSVRLLLKSLLISLVLFLVFVCMNRSLLNTYASNTSFLVALTVVFVPILEVVFLGHRLKVNMLVSVLLAFIGVFLLSLGTDSSFRFGAGRYLLWKKAHSLGKRYKTVFLYGRQNPTLASVPYFVKR